MAHQKNVFEFECSCIDHCRCRSLIDCSYCLSFGSAGTSPHLTINHDWPDYDNS